MDHELTVSTDDPTPPYEQLRRQFHLLIGTGTLAPGTRLPPLRQLAGDLGLAVGTVARTYRELESAGLVHSRRGAGTRVANPPARSTTTDSEARLRALMTGSVAQALALGATPDLVRSIIEDALRAAGRRPTRSITGRPHPPDGIQPQPAHRPGP